MSEYSEILFRRKDDARIYPDQARKLVAAACDGIDIDPAIFNRDASGKTISGTYGAEQDGEGFGIPPRIVFDGGRGYIRIYGLGHQGVKLLQSEAVKLFSALYKQGFIGFEEKSGDLGIEYQGDNTPLYSIRCLVVARKPGACKPFVKTGLEGEVAQKVGEIILRGMTGMARMLDEETEKSSETPKLESLIPNHVDLLEGDPFPILIKPGIWGAAYKDVLLTFPCKLTGPWHTGLLRSRGYGHIRAINLAQG